jgi:hypothetical protein
MCFHNVWLFKETEKNILTNVNKNNTMWDLRRATRNISSILHAESRLMKKSSQHLTRIPVVGIIASGATTAVGGTLDIAGSSVGRVADVTETIFGKPPIAPQAKPESETTLKRFNRGARLIQLGTEDFTDMTEEVEEQIDEIP